MRMYGHPITVLAVVLIILAANPVLAGAKPAKSAEITMNDQALSLAKATAKRFGWPLDRNLQVQCLAPMPNSGGAWVVIFSPEEERYAYIYTFTLDAATGRLLSASDERSLRLAGMLSVDTPSYDDVKSRTFADSYLQKAGVDNTDLTLTYNAAWIDPTTKKVSQWIVEYYRTYQGLFFETDKVSVTLNPKNGKLISLNYLHTSPLPDNTVAHLTKEQACSAADAYLFAQKNVHYDSVKDARLMIATRIDDATKKPTAYLRWHIQLSWGNDQHARGLLVDDPTGAVSGTYLEIDNNKP